MNDSTHPHSNPNDFETALSHQVPQDLTPWELAAFERYYPSAPETGQLVYALASAGVDSASQMVFLSRNDFSDDQKTLTFYRGKTGVLQTIGITDRLAVIFDRRFARGGVYAGYYLLPEILFGPNNVHCAANGATLTGEARSSFGSSAVRRAQALFRRFAIASGVTRRGVNIGSIRRHNISVLASIGMQPAVVAAIAGVSWTSYGTVDARALAFASEQLEAHYRALVGRDA